MCLLVSKYGIIPLEKWRKTLTELPSTKNSLQGFLSYYGFQKDPKGSFMILLYPWVFWSSARSGQDLPRHICRIKICRRWFLWLKRFQQNRLFDAYTYLSVLEQDQHWILFDIIDISVLSPISRNESEWVCCHHVAFVSLALFCAIFIYFPSLQCAVPDLKTSGLQARHPAFEGSCPIHQAILQTMSSEREWYMWGIVRVLPIAYVGLRWAVGCVL